MPSVRINIALLCLFCLWVSTTAVIFDIPKNSRKCLSDEVSKSTLVEIEYDVLDALSGKPKVGFVLTDPKNQILKSEEEICIKGKESYVFTSTDAGIYQVCFDNANPQNARMFMNFKQGVEAEDYSEIAKREHLMPVEQELRKLEDLVEEIHRDMTYLREREAVMRSTNESTNARVLWFSLLSIVVLLGMGAWQVLYLKKFFKSKKLI